MKEFLFENFHKTIEGKLNPYQNNININYEKKLDEFLSKGIKPNSFIRVEYAEKRSGDNNEPIKHHYWFRDYWKLFPDKIDVAIRETPSSELLSMAKGAIDENDTVIGAYQFTGSSVELIIEPNTEVLSKYELRLHYYNLLFRTEYSKIIHGIDFYTSINTEKKPKRKFIGGMQESVYRYMSRIGHLFHVDDPYWHKDTEAESETAIFKLLLQYLDGIMLYVYENYREYLNLTLNASPCIRKIHRLNLEHHILKVDTLLSAGHFSNSLKIAVKEITDVAVNLEYDHTLSTTLASEKLIIGIADVLGGSEDSNEQSISSRIEYQCRHYGLNSSSFVYHLKHNIEVALQSVAIDRKAVFIKDLMRKLNNERPISKLKFNPALLPLKEQIENWLLELLTSLEKEEVPRHGKGTVERKLKFKDSIAVLGVLLHGVFEIGILDWESKREAAQFASKVIATSGTNDISVKNLYNKLLYPNYKACEKAQKHLIGVHDVIEALKDS